MTEKYHTLIMLAGEQTAPNLLAARHFNPGQVIILHTDFPKSGVMAGRLELRLEALNPQLIPIDAYDPGKITHQISALLPNMPGTLINITGGTKPMSIGALEAARQAGCQPIYVTSQGAQTNLDFYAFADDGTPFIREQLTIENVISLEDYLVSYFGKDYQFTGYGGEEGSQGQAFEQAIHQALAPHVDEIEIGWKHASGAVDVDAVMRCNNQVGIMEIKTGNKARTTEGIKQLAVAGGQRFFGTYTKRFLVIDRAWPPKSNNKALAEALGIALIELPGFGSENGLTIEEQNHLIQSVHRALSAPTKKDQ